MEKIILDQEKCIGCGACCTIAKENFTYNDEGKASVINDKVTDKAKQAINACPTKAISIEENCECNENCCCGDNCNCTEDNCCCNDCDCETNCSCGDECHCTEEHNCGCKN